MQQKRRKKSLGSVQTHRLLSLVLVLYVFVSILLLNPKIAAAKKSDSVFSLFNLDKTKQTESTQTASSDFSSYGIIDQVSGLIYQGDFEAAGSLIEEARKEESDQQENTRLAQYELVVDEYQEIQKKLQSSRDFY
ncbi:MAG: hypothetical protein ACYTE8_06535 [Planctomycetota bacterium]